MLPNYINAEMSDFIIQHTTYITILPSMELEELRFISGTFGPFKPTQYAKVPLWVAIELKRKNKCKIITPDWLQSQKLEVKVEQEKIENDLMPIENYYYEFTQILLAHCKDDLQDECKIQQLIDELYRLRETKIQSKIKDFLEKGVDVIKLNNISLNERNQIQSRFYGELRKMRLLKQQSES